MSNVVQAGLTIVGTAVGFAFGYPQLGFMLGNLAGQALAPTQLPGVKGPRLQDLQVQSAALGAPVPLVYGTEVLAGNIIWSGGLIETATTTEVGGKGGPTQKVTEYSYKVNVAIGLCEGPIAGIRRIWADTKLIYDISEQKTEANGWSDGDGWGSRGEAYAEWTNRLQASEQAALYFTLYEGSESQLADPTIESYEGAGNVPAYRGLAYLVFNDFELADYGNRIPNFRVEVFTAGAVNCETVTEYGTDLLLPWASATDPINPLNNHTFRVHGDGRSFADPNHPSYSWRDTRAEAVADAAASRGSSLEYFLDHSILAYSLVSSDNGLTYGMGFDGAADRDRVSAYLHYNDYSPDRTQQCALGSAGAQLGSLGTTVGEIVLNNYIGFGYLTSDVWAGLGFISDYPDAATLPPWYGRTGYGDFGPNTGSTPEYNKVYSLRNALIEVKRVVRAPLRPSEEPTYTEFTGLPGFYLKPDGTLVEDTAWEQQAGTWRWLQQYATASDTDWDGEGSFLKVSKYPLGPARPSTHAEYNDAAFWTAAYEAAVADGDMAAGLVYGVDYPVAASYGYVREYQQCTASTERVSIASIVSDLCTRAGLADHDVSDLTRDVTGYMVGRVMPARDAIEGVRAYGRFDAAEIGEDAVFIERGGAAVYTFTEDELATHAAGETRPAVVEVSRVQDVELPRKLRVHYQAIARDFEPGEQYAARLTTNAVQIVDQEVALALTDNEAAELAEVLLYEAWVGRNAYRFATDWARLELTPADVVELPVDGELVRCRIVAVDDDGVGPRRFEAVRDDDGVLTSYAAGGVAPGGTDSLTVISPVDAVLLDLPGLRDEDDDAGYYVAFRSLVTDSWNGAALFRSADGGVTYTAVASSTTQATIGTLAEALPSGVSTVWDLGNTIRVNLLSGSFSSASEASVLAGSNALAIGAHGRWEVVQFQTAAQDADGVWELSGLLRGRRGTEHNIGTGAAGDDVVLLSGGGIVRVGLDVSRVGTSQKHKAVAVAQSLDEVTAEDFAGAGEALKPFSPVHVAATRNDAGDVALSWIRRGRIGEELPSGTDIALSEEAADYEVDIVRSGSVVRTLSVSAQAATYTAAQQVTDFGSVQAALSVVVYQVSASVGRGAGVEATI